MNNKINKSKVFELLKMSQMELKAHLYQELKKYDYNPISADGFIFAQGTLSICMVAHMDTVLQQPKFVNYKNGIMSCPTGLGADDRAGVYGVLHLLEQGHRPSIIFTEDEEIGGVGASKFASTHIDIENLGFFIQLDRRGYKDSVYYDCGNENFQKYINSYGFETAIGSFSDISILMEDYKTAGVNFSVGYLGEHTVKETLNIPHLARTLKLVGNILTDSNDEVFEYNGVEFNWMDSYGVGDKVNYNYGSFDSDSDLGLIELDNAILVDDIGNTIETDFSNDIYYIDSSDKIFNSNYVEVKCRAYDHNYYPITHSYLAQVHQVI